MLLEASVCRWVLVAFHVDLKYWGSPAMVTVVVDGINSKDLECSDLEIFRGCSGTLVASSP